MSRRIMSKTKICFTPEAIFEIIPDAVIAIDVKKNVLWLNQAAEKLGGLSRTNAVGRPCSAVLHSSMCGDTCMLHRSLKAGKSMVNAPAFINSGEKRIDVSVSIALMKDADGRVIGAVETIRELPDAEPLNLDVEREFPVFPHTSRNAWMQKVLDSLPQISRNGSTVLIFGETGTGKELVARAIHALSPRSHHPFIAINCGGLPETLLESELFGCKRGAFTGADKDKPGHFALAGRGTLFMDEIGNLSLASQASLLRVLDVRAYHPLGATHPEKTDARIILATNRDLAEAVRKGEFRADLYHRIDVLRVELPPLRQRREDIEPLVAQFLGTFNRLHGKCVQTVTAEALALLLAYDWPGNVRELRNAIEKSVLLCNEKLIEIEHLPPTVNGQAASAAARWDLRSAMHLLEIQAMRLALEHNAHNRLAAAKELGWSKAKFFRRIKALGLPHFEQN